ncbi:MAG: hypothetical protein SOR77_00630 [Peptoniphilus sp.]|uniref:hypothetical protein n=1 Tax=Peptoniphilus sp. TaxID=1971214 RepID=UPI002A760250|nr:hypothetical protein [Peptoniphilus sp.]MDY2986114.1 hypothetical protein [Peptoniphilus sp.]
MYKVPMEIPEYCDDCPFGMTKWSLPLTNNSKGYQCNVDFKINGKYTKTIQGTFDEKIKKPEWCYLEEIEE